MIGSRWSNLTVLLSYCFLKGYSQYAVIKKGITVIYSLSLATVWSFSCIFTPACLLGSGNLVKHLSFLFIQWLSLRLSVWERESEWERNPELALSYLMDPTCGYRATNQRQHHSGAGYGVNVCPCFTLSEWHINTSCMRGEVAGCKVWNPIWHLETHEEAKSCTWDAVIRERHVSTELTVVRKSDYDRFTVGPLKRDISWYVKSKLNLLPLFSGTVNTMRLRWWWIRRRQEIRQ